MKKSWIPFSCHQPPTSRVSEPYTRYCNAHGIQVSELIIEATEIVKPVLKSFDTIPVFELRDFRNVALSQRKLALTYPFIDGECSFLLTTHSLTHRWHRFWGQTEIRIRRIARRYNWSDGVEFWVSNLQKLFQIKIYENTYECYHDWWWSDFVPVNFEMQCVSISVPASHRAARAVKNHSFVIIVNLRGFELCWITGYSEGP